MKKTVRDLPSEMKEGAVVSTDMKQTMRDVRSEAPSQTPRDIPVADNQHSDKVEKRSARDPRSPVPLTPAGQKSLTL